MLRDGILPLSRRIRGPGDGSDLRVLGKPMLTAVW